MPPAFWFVPSLPVLVVSFFILKRAFTLKIASAVLSSLPLALFLLGFIMTADFMGQVLLINSAGLSLFTSLGGLALLLRAFENGERCFHFIISLCISAAPLLFVVMALFTQGY